MPPAAVIVGGARTAIGRFGGSLKDVEAHELGAVCIREVLAATGVEPGEVDEVVMGQVGQVGPDAYNARRCMLAAGLPPTTTAMNVNRLCSSGLQAIVTASQQVLLGDARVVVAGGDESMSRQPFLDYQARDGWRLGTHQLVDGTLSLLTDPWGHYLMGATAEKVAERYSVDRAAQDRFAARSQELAQGRDRVRRARRRDRAGRRTRARRAVRSGRAPEGGGHSRVARQAAGRLPGRRQRHGRQLVGHQRRRGGPARDG